MKWMWAELSKELDSQQSLVQWIALMWWWGWGWWRWLGKSSQNLECCNYYRQATFVIKYVITISRAIYIIRIRAERNQEDRLLCGRKLWWTERFVRIWMRRNALLSYETKPLEDMKCPVHLCWVESLLLSPFIALQLVNKQFVIWQNNIIIFIITFI